MRNQAPDDLHEVALAAALAGARTIRGVSRDRLGTRDKGGLDDVVTEADLASERVVVAAIRAHRPDDRIVAEESGTHPGSGDVTWYVDPLDGTSNFVAGSPNYAVSVAACRAGRAVAATIYRPADDRWLGTGAGGGLRGSYTPGVVAPRPLAAGTVTVSRPHDPARREVAMALREMLLPHVGTEWRAGAATWALLLVATGGLDAYVSVDIPVWDTAAGHALVERAGGAVRTVRVADGVPVSIAGQPSAVGALTELIGAWTR